ncbi:hypothetical protein SAMN05444157_3365 [Frankineae bacterium MT45]|nr:hypothetical protein SAMN05444157_3365 [Frankineae bacterium MT45]
MSPKRIVSTSETLSGIDVDSDVRLVEEAADSAPGMTFKKAGADATAGPESGAVADGPPSTEAARPVEEVAPTDEPRRATRTTPAAQVANRARRIGGAGLTGSAALDSDSEQSGELSESETAGEPARRGRGMAGRPATKSRVVREESAESVAPSGRRIGTGWIIATAAVVVMLVLAGVNMLVWHPWHKTDQTAALRGEILSSVNQATALAISYDYRKWDDSAKAAEVNLTGQFKTDYMNAMKAQQADATSTKTVAVGKVDNSGLAAINSAGTEATVAVYAERTRTNTTNTDPVTDLLALQIITDKVDGKWKISKLSYIN